MLDSLKNAPAPDEGKAYQTLLGLCKEQGALFDLMIRAATPNAGVALLHDVLAAMQKQNELIQNINLLAASDSTGTFGDCRDLVLQLAIVQPLSSDLMSRIDNLLLGDAPAPLERSRALSVEALTLIYENTDTGFYQLASWHNKMMWLVGCAFYLCLALPFHWAMRSCCS